MSAFIAWHFWNMLARELGFRFLGAEGRSLDCFILRLKFLAICYVLKFVNPLQELDMHYGKL
jgi:hypothetical protein